MVGRGGFEPPTSRLSSARSNQLSYQPDCRSPADLPASCRLYGRDVRTARPRIKRAADRIQESHRIFAGATFSARLSGSPLKSPYGLRQLLRKEVIQPQVPLRLPCYDFTPVADPTVVGCPLAVGTPPSGRTNSHGVTGGVYKARERIHRGVLIRDY